MASPYLAVLAIAFTAETAVAAGPPYRDPLEMPAAKSPLAVTSPIIALARAGERLVAVGVRGHILVSNDQGKTWEQAVVPVSSDLTAAYFPTPREGWAVGHDGVVLHTRDGGSTWEKRLDGRDVAKIAVAYYEVRSARGDANAARALVEARDMADAGPDRPFLDVWFADERNGFVIGAFNLILKTSDGGATWEPWLDRTDNPKGMHLYAIRGAGGSVWIAGEQGLVLRLDAASGRFVAVQTPYNGTYFGVAIAPGSVLAFGLRGNAYRSADGGRTWSKVDTGVDGGITAGAVLDGGRVVLVTQGGQILVSAEGGSAFSRVTVVKPMPYASVASAGPGLLAVAGLQGVRCETFK